MKTLTLCFLFLTVTAMAETEVGTSPMGPATMGQDTYPNSGLRKRTDDVTGSGMSNSTFMSSDVNPAVPPTASPPA